MIWYVAFHPLPTTYCLPPPPHLRHACRLGKIIPGNQQVTLLCKWDWQNGRRVPFRVFGVFRGQKNRIAAQAFEVLPTDKLSGWINSNSGNATRILSREKITGITSLETAAS